METLGPKIYDSALMEPVALNATNVTSLQEVEQQDDRDAEKKIVKLTSDPWSRFPPETPES